jgi:hypothetical protein
MLFALFPGGGQTPGDGSPRQAGKKKTPAHGASRLPFVLIFD